MPSLRPRAGPKQIRQTALTSELGVNLVAKRVMEMGHAWHPTIAAFDAGIDGFIDLRDPSTNESLNQIIQVQVKSTEIGFARETERTLDFTCNERDLAHWRRGNAPVVLVVTRPATNEAYWVSIKEHFKDPVALRDRRVVFDKARDSFDNSAATALRRLAVKTDAGLYISPLAKAELLFSNLLSVARLPVALYSAITPLGKRYEVEQALGDYRVERSEFVYRGKRILSAHDISAPEWKDIVDRGTVEEFATSEWAGSDDDERLTDFSELLSRCLSQRTRALGMTYDRSHEYYYYRATADGADLPISYLSLKSPTKRFVFKKYKTRGGYPYYRHSAFNAAFRRYDGEWYLAITPTYHFTEDGHKQLRFYESKLKGIKALEKNPAVLGQVVFFASMLMDPEADLFNATPYPFLGFGALRRFTLDVGLTDSAWLPTEEEKAVRENANPDDLEIASEIESLPQLFDELLDEGIE